MRGQDGILIVALLDPQTEIDLVFGSVGERERSKLLSQIPQRHQACFDGRSSARFVSRVESLLRVLGRSRDCGKSGGQGLWRIGSGITSDAYETGVNTVKERCLCLF